MDYYKISHPSTGKVVNLYSLDSTSAVANGTRLLLYSWQNNNDQKWGLEYVGNYVLMRLARDTSKVINRHSSNNNAIVWTYDGSTETQMDSLINTETENGNMRIKLVHRNLYLTKNSSDNYLYWASKMYDSRQYFKLEQIGSTTGSGLSLRYPVSYSYISTYFGNGHRGVDFVAAKGTPVYAAARGRVIRIHSWGGSKDQNAVDSIGNAVFLEHFDSSGNTCGMTCYYHLREAPTALISENQIVEEGTQIGYVGNTGYVVASTGDGSHLHFEVKTGSSFNNSTLATLYHSGTWVNPLSYINH